MRGVTEAAAKTVLEVRSCGDDGPELPVLGMGRWSFGGSDYWGKQDQDEVHEIVEFAISQGCNYFDTAETCNERRSEISLGLALEGKRDKTIIGSKVSPHNSTPALLRKHCEASLRRLATDYVDVYMVHWPINTNSIRHFTDDQSVIENPPGMEDAFHTLEALKSEGKVRSYCVSNFGTTQLSEVLRAGDPVMARKAKNLLCKILLRNSCGSPRKSENRCT